MFTTIEIFQTLKIENTRKEAKIKILKSELKVARRMFFTTAVAVVAILASLMVEH